MYFYLNKKSALEAPPPPPPQVSFIVWLMMILLATWAYHKKMNLPMPWKLGLIVEQ